MTLSESIIPCTLTFAQGSFCLNQDYEGGNVSKHCNSASHHVYLEHMAVPQVLHIKCRPSRSKARPFVSFCMQVTVIAGLHGTAGNVDGVQGMDCALLSNNVILIKRTLCETS